jgi:hypothetical protein
MVALQGPIALPEPWGWFGKGWQGVSQQGLSILTTLLSEPKDSWRLRPEIQLRSEAWLLSVE